MKRGGENDLRLASPWVRLRSGTNHPFVYRRMLGEADPNARPGNVVNVYDKHGAFFGRALYNPKSQIALRMLAFDDRPIDDEFWRGRITDAIILRKKLGLDRGTDAYRLVHAEGDALSGLILERYADVLVAEIFSLGIFQRCERIIACAAAALGPPASLERGGRCPDSWRIVLRADPHIERTEGFNVPAERRDLPGRLIIREHGVRYRVDVSAGHKTGFFCDQRDNRKRLASLCADATVLDLCCYTGGFGLAAKAIGDAREVTCVDLDEAALAVAQENVNLNNQRIGLVHSDAFIYLRQMIANKRQYDVVVLDPPKLAPTRTDLDAALRKYYDLNGLAMQVVRPGGILLTCSCSGLVSREVFLHTIQKSARYAGRTLQLLDITGAGPDHPVMMNCPESSYLKAAWLRVT